MQLTYTTFGSRQLLDKLGIQYLNYRKIKSQNNQMIILICLDQQIKDSDTIYVPQNVLYHLNYPLRVNIENVYPPIQNQQINSNLTPILPTCKQLTILQSQLHGQLIAEIISNSCFILQNTQNYLLDIRWIPKNLNKNTWKTQMIINKEKSKLLNNHSQKQLNTYILLQMQSRKQPQLFKAKETALKIINKSTKYQFPIYQSIQIKGVSNQIYQKQTYLKVWKTIQQKIGKNTIITLQSQPGYGVTTFLRLMCYQKGLRFGTINLNYSYSIKSVNKQISNLYQLGYEVVYVKNIKWLISLVMNTNSNNYVQSSMLSVCLKKIQQLFRQSCQKSLKKCILVMNYPQQLQEVRQQFNENYDIKLEIDKKKKQQYTKTVFDNYFSPKMISKQIEEQMELIIESSLELGWSKFKKILNRFNQRLKTSNIQDLQYLKQLIKQIQKSKNIVKVTWDDVGGLQSAKQQIIQTILLPIRHPQIFDEWIKPRTGLLFYGPPGTGKTLLGKCIANQCKMGFISVKGPQLLNMYVGESEKNVRQLFERAAKSSPCIVFMDELDALVPRRGNSNDSNQVMDRIVAELMTQMDTASQNRVFIIGATNRPDLLDPSVLRAGRFDKQIYLGICKTTSERVKILQSQTRNIKLEQGFDFQKIVQSLPQNMTGADFYGLTTKAIMIAMDRLLNDYEHSPQLNHPLPQQVILLQQQFINAAKNVVPSVTKQQLLHYQTLKNKYSSS